MVKKSLQYSILFIVSQWIRASYQECLDTTRIRGSLWAFSLARVDDLSNPLGPQEACYYSCGGEIVTHSANRGNMARLTLMDKSAPILLDMGFLQQNQVYLLNHLGMTEEEGGNGIGCIQVMPGNTLNHYPKSHKVCSNAKVAVCGFWGEQRIPQQPSRAPPSLPSSTSTSSTTTSITTATTTTSAMANTITTTTTSPAPVKGWRNRRPRPNTTSARESLTNAPSPSITAVLSSTSNIESSSETFTWPESSTTTDMIDMPTSPTEGVVEIDPDIVDQFDANDTHYKVVSSLDKSSDEASATCQGKSSKLSDMTSQKYDQVAVKLTTTTASGRKLIIGSWNSDTYSFKGDDCLILQVNYGIYPGSCSEATAVLCEA